MDASRRKRLVVWLSLWVAYAALLGGSYAWRWGRESEAADRVVTGEKRAVEIPDFNMAGEATGRRLRVMYREWGGKKDAAEVPPIILLHGSPGRARDFETMGPELSSRAGGRWVLAPDLPGFGDSDREPTSYSVRAHARSVLAMMDQLDIEHAHVLGWSMGGGVVLNMAELAPQRVDSITMLAAIGDQRTEGSGSYSFEHAKYALGEASLWALHRFVPHFGLIPEPRGTVLYSTMRNFGDSDQRPLTGIMQGLTIPTLIIAGDDDFLVPLRAAELHHRLIRPSKLVVMDATHFMPFLQPGGTASHIADFLEHDAPEGAGLDRRAVYFGGGRVAPFGDPGRWGTRLLTSAPWWALVAGVAIFLWWRPFFGAAVAAALINTLKLDWGVGMLGVWTGVAGGQLANMATGAAWRRKRGKIGISRGDWTRRLERTPPGFVLAWRAVFRPDIVEHAPRAVGWLSRSPLDMASYTFGAVTAGLAWALATMLPLLVIAAMIALRLRESLGWAGTGATVVILWLWARSFVLLFTWTGRRMLLARITRAKRQEYWPPWIFYAPLVPYLAWQALRAGHPLAFSACNPGVPRGGGLIGESKYELQSRLDASPGIVLPYALIPEHPSASHRAAEALARIGSGQPIGDFPVILKPDAGLRGFSVRLAQGPEDVAAYFEEMTRPVMLQKYHPGPYEIGVMWARRLGGPPERRGQEGMIYSITRKEFPFVTGDGVHTLEQLIYRHPRHRCQAATFLERFADDASRVVPSGERVRLAQAGNHCQGTLFRDGADLATPALLHVLDKLSLSFAADEFSDPTARGGLDIARYDLRYESEDELRAGRGFAVIEINGTTGESTNLYDPDKSLFWCYGVLFGQWRMLYELGAWRRDRNSLGAETWSLWRLAAALREFYRDRPGSALAD